MFFIPFFIIIAIMAGSVVVNIVTSGDFLSPFLPGEEQKEKTEAGTSSQPSPGSSALQQGPTTRAPPPFPTYQKDQTQKSSLSPSFQKIRISSVQPTKEGRPALVRLYPNFSDQSAISITGWELKSKWIGEFKIPLGIAKYHPAFANEPGEPVQVKPSDTIYLSGEPSPLGRGKHFRPNACFGYLKVFYPALPSSSCSEQRPRVEEVSNLKPACQEFILNKINYSSCELPDYSQDAAVATDRECVSYLTSPPNSFTYEGCYARRSQDQNFLQNEWWIYMDTFFGHPLHDTITLFDKEGLLVDTYIY